MTKTTNLEKRKAVFDRAIGDLAEIIEGGVLLPFEVTPGPNPWLDTSRHEFSLEGLGVIAVDANMPLNGRSQDEVTAKDIALNSRIRFFPSDGADGNNQEYYANEIYEQSIDSIKKPIKPVTSNLARFVTLVGLISDATRDQQVNQDISTNGLT
jgi:hypothetical protein